ncbi:MAG TPA: alpha/beta hydrolase [Ktedonobacteraceae bacterium]
MRERFAESMRTGTIDLPAGRFAYRSWGSERAELPAAVLVHGITSSSLSWVRVGPALADRYRVYAFDMRGHGDSIHPAPGSYSLRQTASDTAAFIAALGLAQPLLIGHSWGGATAIMLASGAWSPEPSTPAFSHIILEDPAWNFGQGDPATRAASYVKDIGRSPEELRPEIIASNPGWSAADVEGKLDAMQKVTREAVISVFAEAGAEGDILSLLPRIAAPVLLVRADANLGTTLNAAAWERARQLLPPHSRALEIPDATHNIHRSKFPEFMQAINEFLEQV